MLNFATLSFGIAIVGFLFFSLLLFKFWKDRQQSRWLFISALASSVWFISLLLQTKGFLTIQWIWGLEAIRDFCWIRVMLGYLCSLYEDKIEPQRFFRKWLILSSSLAIIVAFPYQLFSHSFIFSNQQLHYLGFILLNIMGLGFIEQLFRNIQKNNRWAIKYLCLGLASLFSYDLYLYSNAFLESSIDATLWYSRGIVNIIGLFLIMITLSRNPHWNKPVYISRKIIFHSGFLIFCGLFLTFLSFSNLYIQRYAGDYASIIQILVIFIGLLGGIVVIFSGRIRSQVKLIFNKYLFHYRYDYREEWLKLIELLSGDQNKQPLAERSIQALADIVDSTGGHVFLMNAHQQLEEIAVLNTPPNQVEQLTNLNLKFVLKHRIINLEKAEFISEIPQWIEKIDRAWLLIPLIIEKQYIGFIILLKSRVRFQLNWENTQLLLIASQQAASYLAFERMTSELSEARQFEGFNRLSAFVIHDLKNMIAQLSLLTKNAEKHQKNPEFIKDAFKTIDNAVARMDRLLKQLKSLTEEQHNHQIQIQTLLADLVQSRQQQTPPVKLIDNTTSEIYLSAEPDRLYSVIGHIIQNAQDATINNTTIFVRLDTIQSQILIQIEDQGIGMDNIFIKKHLFKPFYTTKGLTGMGIGAYECRDYIQQLGGQVRVNSTLGKGTIFKLILPIATS